MCRVVLEIAANKCGLSESLLHNACLALLAERNSMQNGRVIQCVLQITLRQLSCTVRVMCALSGHESGIFLDLTCLGVWAGFGFLRWFVALQRLDVWSEKNVLRRYLMLSAVISPVATALPCLDPITETCLKHLSVQTPSNERSEGI